MNLLLLVFACRIQTPDDPSIALENPSESQKQETPIVHEVIIQSAMNSSASFERLIELCDDFGPRISGSQALENAGDWVSEQLEKDGLVNVAAQPVTVEHWIRGEESLTMLAPREEPLPMLGLGMSVGTDGQALEGEVLVVSSIEDMQSRERSTVEGRIVLINQPFNTYGGTVGIRRKGPTEAAKLGALALLIRSVAPHGHQTPHTGNTAYDDDFEIPAAAITLEDAERFQRYQDRGIAVRVRLSMDARMAEPAQSANIMGEIVGLTHPEDIIAMGCHLDSWDVGQGAQDDGAGCMMVMEAARILANLEQPPKKTIRAVFFTNEENGLAGGKEYAEVYSQGHIAAIEADIGAGTPEYFSYKLPLGESFAEWNTRLKPLTHSLETLGMTDFQEGFAGADINPLIKKGVIGFGLKMDSTNYWPIHHTHADTIDKVDPVLLKRNSAAMALLAWELANMD